MVTQPILKVNTNLAVCFPSKWQVCGYFLCLCGLKTVFLNGCLILVFCFFHVENPQHELQWAILYFYFFGTNGYFFSLKQCNIKRRYDFLWTWPACPGDPVGTPFFLRFSCTSPHLNLFKISRCPLKSMRISIEQPYSNTKVGRMLHTRISTITNWFHWMSFFIGTCGILEKWIAN